MYKHKIISKNYWRGARQQSSSRRMLFDCDDDDNYTQYQSSLQEIDFTPSSCAGEQSHSIQDLLMILSQPQIFPNHKQILQQQEEEDVENDSPLNTSCMTLEDINAIYMKRLKTSSSSQKSFNSSTIKFDSTVRVKFYNGQQAVAQVSNAQQFETISDQFFDFEEEEDLF